MSLKFKPDSFLLPNHNRDIAEMYSMISQRIFDEWIKENGKVVFSRADKGEWKSAWPTDMNGYSGMTFKAILINIEPLEKCTHPKEKIETYTVGTMGEPHVRYKCYCGASVTPKEFCQT